MMWNIHQKICWTGKHFTLRFFSSVIVFIVTDYLWESDDLLAVVMNSREERNGHNSLWSDIM